MAQKFFHYIPNIKNYYDMKQRSILLKVRHSADLRAMVLKLFFLRLDHDSVEMMSMPKGNSSVS